MPYREDRVALEARLETLTRELAGLEARAEELDALERNITETRRQLAEVRRLLDQLSPCQSSPLDDLRIASPCSADWNQMDGNERVRFCGQCQKNVYNLSALPRLEAERLLHESEGQICIRLYRRTDGTVLTADCPTGVRKRRRRRIALVAAGSALMATAAVSATMVQMGSRARTERVALPTTTMGTVALPSVPARLPDLPMTKRKSQAKPETSKKALMGKPIMGRL
jgi:hypothetical protein